MVLWAGFVVNDAPVAELVPMVVELTVLFSIRTKEPLMLTNVGKVLPLWKTVLLRIVEYWPVFEPAVTKSKLVVAVSMKKVLLETFAAVLILMPVTTPPPAKKRLAFTKIPSPSVPQLPVVQIAKPLVNELPYDDKLRNSLFSTTTLFELYFIDAEWFKSWQFFTVTFDRPLLMATPYCGLPLPCRAKKLQSSTVFDAATVTHGLVDAVMFAVWV
jgi:hypothetical protein